MSGQNVHFNSELDICIENKLQILEIIHGKFQTKKQQE